MVRYPIKKSLFKIIDAFSSQPISMTPQLINIQAIIHKYFYGVICKEIVTESFMVTYMTAVARAVLFRSESKGSGFLRQ